MSESKRRRTVASTNVRVDGLAVRISDLQVSLQTLAEKHVANDRLLSKAVKVAQDLADRIGTEVVDGKCKMLDDAKDIAVRLAALETKITEDGPVDTRFKSHWNSMGKLQTLSEGNSDQIEKLKNRLTFIGKCVDHLNTITGMGEIHQDDNDDPVWDEPHMLDKTATLKERVDALVELVGLPEDLDDPDERRLLMAISLLDRIANLETHRGTDWAEHGRKHKELKDILTKLKAFVGYKEGDMSLIERFNKLWPWVKELHGDAPSVKGRLTSNGQSISELRKAIWELEVQCGVKHHEKPPEDWEPHSWYPEKIVSGRIKHNADWLRNLGGRTKTSEESLCKLKDRCAKMEGDLKRLRKEVRSGNGDAVKTKLDAIKKDLAVWVQTFSNYKAEDTKELTDNRGLITATNMRIAKTEKAMRWVALFAALAMASAATAVGLIL